ncbi:MAG: DUF2723 domain-containing protein [Ekhidna sp.]
MKLDPSVQVKGRWLYFAVALTFQFVAILLMALDSSPHGFSTLSLTVAPILLITGILLPVVGLSKLETLRSTLKSFKVKSFQSLGFIGSFLVAFITYALTLEPTASLWDCSETIATAYKLQVPHTPGTPLTLLIARLFSMLAMGDVYKVAWFINLMSGFFSALAVGILFLFTWHFGRKLFQNKWVVLIGSFGGALCLTFSDSFWFSAVEAETYGPSVFFMLLLIWLSIRGSFLEGYDRKLKLLQIAYFTGLSYCIHPMCILILPVCALIWRFRYHPLNWKQITISLAIGLGSILFISKVIAVDLFEWAFRLDLLLVNGLSLPMYSGVFALLLIIALVITVVWRKVKKSRLTLMALCMVVLGFTPYMMLFVRSSKLPPINEFAPNNLAKIKPYMNRESYPSRPLLYGPYFDSSVERTSTKATSYIVKDGRYEEVGTISQYHYKKNDLTILPRMYSKEPAHVAVYHQWTGLTKGEEPRFADNLRFMFRYQLGEMYLRYFLWNFAGRVSDVQHAGWLAPWEDAGDRSHISYSKAANQYFMLPLLLGMLGLLFQFKKDRKGFVTNLSFFFITGFLLAIYLNATPVEPRERDYIYVGSYVAFSLWIGLGMMSLFDMIKRKWSLYISGLVALAVPAWMLYQNLDDHDRSGRTFQMEHARSVLGSCEKNAILFTGGDNDTFPMWYLQDVEGFRTDVRVKVLSYFNADWYINQLSREYYDSPAAKLTLKDSENRYGPYNPLYINEQTKAPILWNKYMEELKKRNPQLILSGTGESEYFYLPSRRIELPTSQGKLQLSIAGSYLPKSELAILDLISSNEWSRPIYFNFTGLSSLQTNFRPYLVQEGLVYKLTAESSKSDGVRLDLEKSYENLVKKVDYSSLKRTDVYFNHEDYQSRMIVPIKFTFNSLIQDYLEDEQKDEAEKLILFVNKHLYHDHLEPSYADIQLAGTMSLLAMDDAAEQLVQRTFQFFYEKISQQLALNHTYAQNDLFILQEAVRFLKNPQSLALYQTLVDQIRNE